MSLRFTIITIIVAMASATVPPAVVHADQPQLVHFDLPPISAASPSEIDSSDPTLVTIQLRLSAMIQSVGDARVDQWIVQCQPRDRAASIVDYTPRTETSSDLAGAIQVKETEEENNVLGLSLDANYSNTVRGNLGADRAQKNTSTRQFERLAAEQAVTAAGTINRGRGVYFKLRWTAQQVLEGEKNFSLTLRVPDTWRGGLVDVSVIAQTEQKSFAPWDRETKTIGSAAFVVATFREGDNDARTQAIELAEAEDALRRLAAKQPAPIAVTSLPSMIRSVAIKLDLEPSRDQSWLGQLLLGHADPHLDKTIRKLPMPVRVAVLDYADLRDDFAAMNRPTSMRHHPERVAAAKPAIGAESDPASKR